MIPITFYLAMFALPVAILLAAVGLAVDAGRRSRGRRSEER